MLTQEETDYIFKRSNSKKNFDRDNYNTDLNFTFTSMGPPSRESMFDLTRSLRDLNINCHD